MTTPYTDAYAELLTRLRTPVRHEELIVAPSGAAGATTGAYDSHGVDAPFLFRHAGRWQMTHIGFDGIGYRTGLASSSDGLIWRREGLIIDRGPAGSPTEFNAALTWIVRDNDLWGPATLTPVNGRWLGTYHAYPAAGYEAGPAAIGLCWAEGLDAEALRHWQLDPPLLHARDGAEWERGGLYKSCIVLHEGTFYMFYNAKNHTDGPWLEQIGLATSRDLRHWERHPANPLLTVGPQGAWDDVFSSDPCVLRAGDVWVMFYYGLSASDHHARDGVAFSRDLIHWEKAREPLLDVGPEGSLDSRYAHKPGIISDAGRLYHYYCAVRPATPSDPVPPGYGELRGIGVRLSEG